MTDIAGKIRAGIWGVLVADAIGIPHQFKVAAHIPKDIEMVMPKTYSKTFPKIPYGAWSDDGSLTLALADSLGRKGSLDLNDFGQALVNWYEKAAYTPTNKTYDVGNTTMEAILRIERGHEARVAGLTQESANGNGSLMRTLPLALWHKGTDAELYRDACLQSAVTHGHDIAQACCGVYCVAARHLLVGDTSTDGAWIQGLSLAHVKLPFKAQPEGSGYVLDSLNFAIQASRRKDPYEKVVLDAIHLGADTDTTAAIAGGIVATRDGLAAIPSKWLDSLLRKDLATPIIESLIRQRGV